MNIWGLCVGEQWVKNIAVEPWRVVEAQHILSARDLVDTREEHDLLEELIEQSKPSIDSEKDYLIFTPFRYPPLEYGSRFGAVHETSLWYGSLSLETAFTEVAYYRFLFLNDSSADLGYLEIAMTAFTAFLVSQKAIDLTEGPFQNYLEPISHQSHYDDSQGLGTAMRRAGVETFLYYSARAKQKEKNVAAFTPAVFQRKNSRYVNHQQNWICFANREVIEFTRRDLLGKERFTFLAKDINE